MPNVFTPNGDAANAIYGPIVNMNESFTSFNCKVFNRWGNLMYEFDDMSKGWNGLTQAGAVAEDGVYFYNITATDVSGNELKQQGFFHLFKD